MKNNVYQNVNDIIHYLGDSNVPECRQL